MDDVRKRVVDSFFLSRCSLAQSFFCCVCCFGGMGLFLFFFATIFCCVLTRYLNVVEMPNLLLSSHRPFYQCPDCPRILNSSKGLTQHCNSAHREFTPPSDDLDDPGDEDGPYTYHLHPFLNGKHHPLILFSFTYHRLGYSNSL